MAAKVIALREASQPAFQTYAHQIVENARSLAQYCMEKSLHVLTGGTDNHLFLIDVAQTPGLTERPANPACGNVQSRLTATHCPLMQTVPGIPAAYA